MYFNPSLSLLILLVSYKISMIARSYHSSFNKCACTKDPWYELQKGKGVTQLPWEIILLLLRKCQRIPLYMTSFQVPLELGTTLFQPKSSGCLTHYYPPFSRRVQSQLFWVSNPNSTEGFLVSNLYEQCQLLHGHTAWRLEVEWSSTERISHWILLVDILPLWKKIGPLVPPTPTQWRILELLCLTVLSQLLHQCCTQLAW